MAVYNFIINDQIGNREQGIKRAIDLANRDVIARNVIHADLDEPLENLWTPQRYMEVAFDAVVDSWGAFAKEAHHQKIIEVFEKEPPERQDAVRELLDITKDDTVDGVKVR